eukprot:4756983-Amphidinium_carterae.5
MESLGNRHAVDWQWGCASRRASMGHHVLNAGEKKEHCCIASNVMTLAWYETAVVVKCSMHFRKRKTQPLATGLVAV